MIRITMYYFIAVNLIAPAARVSTEYPDRRSFRIEQIFSFLVNHTSIADIAAVHSDSEAVSSTTMRRIQTELFLVINDGEQADGGCML